MFRPRFTASFFAALTLTLGAWSAAFGARPEIPEAWQRPLRMDREFNVVERQSEILKDEQLAVKRMYYWDVPASKVEEYRSAFLDGETEALVSRVRKGRRYVRIYALGNSEYFPEIKRRLGPPQGFESATKMQSHNTYFEWDHRGSGGMDRYLKPQANGSNTAWTSENAVRMNDVVERMFAEAKDPEVTLLPERYGVSLKLGEDSYSYSVRAAKPLRAIAGTELLPLHGFIGSPDGLGMYARIAKKTPAEWLETELVPKFGRLMGKLHFRDGLHPVLHTQNVLIQVDPKTGELKGFVLRDMNDVMLDSGMRGLLGKAENAKSVKGFYTSRLNDFFVDDGAKYTQVRPHMDGYSWQTLQACVSEELPAGRIASKFMEAYADEAVRQSGVASVAIDFRAFEWEAEKYRLRLIQGKYPQYIMPLGRWMESVHDQVWEQLMPKLRVVADPDLQSRLGAVMQASLENEQIAWLSPEARSRLVGPDGKWLTKANGNTYAFAFDGAKVWLVREKDLFPIAVTHKLHGNSLRSLRAGCAGQLAPEAAVQALFEPLAR